MTQTFVAEPAPLTSLGAAAARDAADVPAAWPAPALYCVGFALDPTGRVALIRKSRPDWQAGKLNGIGGHVEHGESPHAAMAREFLEETGVAVPHWEALLSLRFGGGQLWVYRAQVTAAVLDACRTTTDEDVVIASVGDVIAAQDESLHEPGERAGLREGPGADLRAVANLAWLLPLAAFTEQSYRPFAVSVR